MASKKRKAAEADKSSVVNALDRDEFANLKQFLNALLDNTDKVADLMDEGDFEGAVKAAGIKLPSGSDKKRLLNALQAISMNDLRRAAEALRLGDRRLHTYFN